MFKNIFIKSLYEKRFATLGWFLIIALVAYITMVFYPTLSQQSIDDIVNSVPQSLQSLVGTTNDFTTIPGYIGQQIFGPNIVLLAIVMSIILFLGISSGDEERGALKTLLSFPKSRRSVYIQKYLAILTIAAIVVIGIVVGLYIGLFQIGESTSLSRVIESAIACLLMVVAYGTAAYALAMGTANRGLTIAVASGYAFLSFIVSSLAISVKQLKFIDNFSIYHYYNNPQIMSNGPSYSNYLVLSLIIIGMFIFGLIGFLRRDIKC